MTRHPADFAAMTKSELAARLAEKHQHLYLSGTHEGAQFQ